MIVQKDDAVKITMSGTSGNLKYREEDQNYLADAPLKKYVPENILEVRSSRFSEMRNLGKTMKSEAKIEYRSDTYDGTLYEERRI